MAHSYTSIMVHYVFSTKNRRKIITPDLEERLWPYMGGIARENKMKVWPSAASRIMPMFSCLCHRRFQYRQQIFVEEYRAILKKHGIAYDERYLLG